MEKLNNSPRHGGARQKVAIILLGGLALLNFFVWYAVFREDRHGILSVYFFDVGQGDAIFIDAPSGNQILLDGGPSKIVLSQLGKAMPFYDRTIDAVMVSHPHMDHIGGLPEVFRRYSVAGYLDSGTEAKTPEYQALAKAAENEGIPKITLKSGMKIDLGGGAVLQVLSPFVNSATADPHQSMLVLKLVYGKTSFLFEGDMESNMESYLVSVYGKNLKSDVLKVAHHGSKNSSSEMFLGYVSPENAVISVGKGNSYGHPAEMTLQKLTNLNAQVLRTDQMGMIEIKSDGTNISF